MLKTLSLLMISKNNVHIHSNDMMHDKPLCFLWISIKCLSRSQWLCHVISILSSQAPASELVKYDAEKNELDDLHAIKLGLLFRANDEHFIRDSLQLKCTSSITLVYHYEASFTLSGGTPKNHSVNGRFTFREGMQHGHMQAVYANQQPLEVPGGLMRRDQEATSLSAACLSSKKAIKRRPLFGFIDLPKSTLICSLEVINRRRLVSTDICRWLSAK